MVMAESERESRPESSSTNSVGRLQWLRQRREILQEKLIKKNNELKNLCIDEAELTGVLPPEIPLDPGESPPLFRRRVGTLFAYPQNLINKLKTSQAEESALELERQIQTAIAKKAYVIFNDPVETKAVRRKHRLVYQQSQGRLKELEIRLNFIRQGYGRLHRNSNIAENTQWQQSTGINDDDAATSAPSTQINVKHRSKKPRPPLETGLERISLSAKINSDKTIKNNKMDQFNDANDLQHLSKYNHNDNGWVATNGPISSCINSGSDSAIFHDFNDNTDMYILADQCRTRTYSHGNSDDGDLRHAKHQIIENDYHAISGGYGGDEENPSTVSRNNVWSREPKRQYETYNYNQRQQQLINLFKQQPQQKYRNYHQNHFLPTTNEPPSMQSYLGQQSDQQQLSATLSIGQSSHNRYTFYPLGQYSHFQNNSKKNHNKDVQLSGQQGTELVQDQNSRRNNHENVMTPHHDIINSNDSWNNLPASEEEELMKHSSERLIHQPDNNIFDRRKHNENNHSSTSNIYHYQMTNSEMAISMHSTSSSPNKYIKQPPAIENKTISKYANNKQQQENTRIERFDQLPVVTRTQLLRTQSMGSVETWQSVAPTNNTTSTSPVITTTIITMQPTTIANMQSMTTAASVHRLYHQDNHNIPYRENNKEWYETSMDFSCPKSIKSTPIKLLKNFEIPAESCKLGNKRELDGNFDTTNLALSEKLIDDGGRTIVQAGKYQPYKEVTKPFEMSDFYKYSTKFRKKVEPPIIKQGRTINNGHSTGNSITLTLVSGNNKKSNNSSMKSKCDTTNDCHQQTSTTYATLMQRRICDSAQSNTSVNHHQLP